MPFVASFVSPLIAPPLAFAPPPNIEANFGISNERISTKIERSSVKDPAYGVVKPFEIVLLNDVANVAVINRWRIAATTMYMPALIVKSSQLLK